MAIESVSEPYASVDERGYLVSLNADAGRRWRERLKNLATVFYGWVLWTKFNSFRAPVKADRSVIGAGREMAARTEFDPTHPAVCEAMHVYSTLAGIVRAAGARFLVVFLPLSYATTERTRSTGATAEYATSRGKWLSTRPSSAIRTTTRSPVSTSPSSYKKSAEIGKSDVFRA